MSEPTHDEQAAAVALIVAIDEMVRMGQRRFGLHAPTPALAEIAERLMLDAYAAAERRNAWKGGCCVVRRNGCDLIVELTRPT